MAQDTTRTLKDYRPQHDDNCEIFMCSGGCGSTAWACRVAGDGTCQTGHKPCSCGLDALLRVTPHAPAEVERTREELENAIQAAHEEPNLERLYQLGQKIGECIKAYGAACRQQGREEQAIGAHETCHDVVCNGNRSKPVGAKGSGCSCEGREVRMLQRLAEKDQEIARLSGELKLTHAHYGTDLKDAQEEIARLESRLAALSETLTELGNRVRAGVEAAPWVVAELEQALAELRKVNQSMRDRVL